MSAGTGKVEHQDLGRRASNKAIRDQAVCNIGEVAMLSIVAGGRSGEFSLAPGRCVPSCHVLTTAWDTSLTSSQSFWCHSIKLCVMGSFELVCMRLYFELALLSCS